MSIDFPPEHENPTRLSSDFMTAEELVERYRGRISLRTLSNWRHAGKGPRFTKIGGRVLYPVEGVLEWERKRTST